MSEIIRVHLNFKGYVQGVGFRYTAYHTATMYGLTGWVKNEWNGSVTVEAQGDPATIDMFIQKVKDGHFIEVLDMTKATIPPEDESSFQIRYMLWKIDDFEEESKDRMLLTLDFQSKEKYALTVYLKTESGLEAIEWASMREVNPGVYEDMGIAIGPDFVGKGYGKQILNALCDEARNQGAKEFHCSYREKNLALKRLQDACGFKFDYRSEEKTDPRTGEINVVVNAKKNLQYVV